MKFPPAVWGPIFWMTMHIVALGYPESPSYSEKKAAKEFYEGLQHLIPCPTCKLHYAENLKNLPVTPSLDNRRDLFKWTVDMHNMVNKQLGKPIVSQAEALKFIERLGAKNRSPIWRKEDMAEIDMGSFVKGAVVTGTACAAAIGLLWYLNNH
jgi:hypothetical protein